MTTHSRMVTHRFSLTILFNLSIAGALDDDDELMEGVDKGWVQRYVAAAKTHRAQFSKKMQEDAIKKKVEQQQKEEEQKQLEASKAL